MHRSRTGDDDGFTLVEMVIALLVLAIVMAAMGPAFYGMMRASASSDQRSVADGLAVGVSEQIRSLPYYQVGFETTPSYCSASNPVELSYTSPMDSFAKQKTVGYTTYNLETCVYWVAAAGGDTNAYKETWVRVLWGANDQYTYTQTSAIYPGGESSYASGGKQNFAPSGATTTQSATAPPTPTANSATPFTDSPTDTIEVDWQPVTFSSTVQYQVEWWTGSTRPATPSASPDINGTSDGSGGLDYLVTALTPGVTYYFDVVAVSGTQASAPSNAVSAATTAVTSSACTVNSINVTPSSPMIDSSGNPVNFTSLAVAVQATSNCSDLTVEYGINGSSGQPQSPLTTVTLAYVNGSFVGSASQSTWSATTYGFVVYENGTATTAQANVTPCQENPTTGTCS